MEDTVVPVRNQVKAIYAGAVAGLTALIAVAPDGVTLVEGLGVVLAVVVAYGGTYGLDNKDSE